MRSPGENPLFRLASNARRRALVLVALAGAGALAGGCNLVSGLSELHVGDTGDTTTSSGGTGGGNGGTTASGGATGGGGTSTSTDVCSNKKQDVEAGETAIDCGGPSCAPCALGLGCVANKDCESGICRTDPSSPDPSKLCRAVTKIAAGNGHACAVLDTKELFCWGANTHGQLGTGTVNDSAQPQKVDLAKVVDVSAGGPPDDKDHAHSCALTENGDVFCWGSNDADQLGTSDPQDATLPPLVPVITMAKGLAAGGQFTCAIQMDDSVACWGDDKYNQLADGKGMASPVPVIVPGIAATALSAGARHACALLGDETVACWGNNERGETASSTLQAAGPLDLIAGITGASLVRASNDFSCAIDSVGLECWGDNIDGQLTDAVAGDMTSTPTALAVTGALDLATGADGDTEPNDPAGGHACAILEGGKVTCWGNNRKGQLGRGAVSDMETTPATIQGVSGVVGIAAGAELTCARFESGAAACWGRNDRGQLGAGQAGNPESSPVNIQWP